MFTVLLMVFVVIGANFCVCARTGIVVACMKLIMLNLRDRKQVRDCRVNVADKVSRSFKLTLCVWWDQLITVEWRIA